MSESRVREAQVQVKENQEHLDRVLNELKTKVNQSTLVLDNLRHPVNAFDQFLEEKRPALESFVSDKTSVVRQELQTTFDSSLDSVSQSIEQFLVRFRSSYSALFKDFQTAIINGIRSLFGERSLKSLPLVFLSGCLVGLWMGRKTIQMKLFRYQFNEPEVDRSDRVVSSSKQELFDKTA